MAPGILFMWTFPHAAQTGVYINGLMFQTYVVIILWTRLDSK